MSVIQKPEEGVNTVGLIAGKVGYSLSPDMHNAAYEHMGISYHYEAWEIAPGQLAPEIQAIRDFGIYGASVGLPHKIDVMDLLDEVDPAAQLIGAVNTIVNKRDADGKPTGELIGYNTDWTGAMQALKEQGIEIADARAMVVGAGGAARAIAYGFLHEGVGGLTIANRTVPKAKALANELKKLKEFKDRDIQAIGTDEITEKLDDIDILYQATPSGMNPGENPPFDPESLPEQGVVVAEAIYDRSGRLTTLVQVARNRGLRVVLGRDMLLHQGIRQVELFTGEEPPITVMRAVLDAAAA